VYIGKLIHGGGCSEAIRQEDYIIPFKKVAFFIYSPKIENCALRLTCLASPSALESAAFFLSCEMSGSGSLP
jgi:hypothetical protein